MIAINGRGRFGGFNARSIASVSSVGIGTSGESEGAGGSDRIHAPPPVTKSPIAPKPLQRSLLDFIVTFQSLVSDSLVPDNSPIMRRWRVAHRATQRHNGLQRPRRRDPRLLAELSCTANR